jgi:hypothetical protein
VNKPYLIQRAKIAQPLKKDTKRLSEAVDFDYMGSAEFEFGALPRSFRRIEKNLALFTKRTISTIAQGDVPLQVWSYLSDSQFAEYTEWLTALRKTSQIYTKEPTHFEIDRAYRRYINTNFWWDIENDVMFGFHKIFMKRVGTHVTVSLAYMNQQKDKK